MPNERYQRIKETVSAAQVAADHGLELQADGQGREKALCPYHDDHDPSLKLFPDGGFKCFACDAVGDAVSLEQHLGNHGSASEAASALEERHYLADASDGLASVSSIRRPRKPKAAPKVEAAAEKKEPKKPKPKRVSETARWIIRDVDGEARALHIRYKTRDEEGEEDKDYSYRNPDGSWEPGRIKTHNLPLYLSERVGGYDASEIVALVEGEKAADAAAGAGLQVVASTAGTNVMPEAEYLEVLRNLRVTLWPDNDDPGRKHMAQMASALQDIAAEVRWFEWEEASHKDDAADHPAVTGGETEALDNLREALREAPAYDPSLHGPEVEKETLGEEEASGDGEGKAGGGKKRSLADKLIDYVQASPQELFVDQFGAPHILWERDEPIPLTSTFDHHIRHLYYEIEGKSVGPDAVRQARTTLEALALVSGEEKELHLRAAWVPEKEKLYYQLGVGRIVEIDRNGYRSASDPPVLFRTLKNLQPLPDPVDGGSFDTLGRWVNLKNARDKRMYIAWLVTAALPNIPRPMLEATGEMGSGKTTASRVAKRALDPGKPEMVRPDPREFLQKASHAHLVMLDNQNSLPEWAVDTLCRLVTGEADSKRVLYTDDDDIIYEMSRGIILNGINAPTERGDARDRTLPIELERIPDSQYRSEKELWTEFATEHPGLLGAIFETLSGALRAKETLQLDKRARLADWSEYAASVYEVLGWGAERFSEDWSQVVKVQNQGTLDGSTLAQTIMHYMENRSEYEGLATDLHAKLETEAEEMNIDVKRDKSWPKSSSWLWRRIKEVRPLLTALGINADRDDDRRGTIIRLSRTAPDGPGGSDPGDEDKRGSSDTERGSISNLLPRVLPQAPSDSYAESHERGSSGSISTNSERTVPRASEEEEANSPQNPENLTDSATEKEGVRKVPRNASTASDAATEGVSGPREETREAEIDEALADLDSPRGEAPGADAGGSESSGNEKAVARLNALLEQRRRELGIEEGE